MKLDLRIEIVVFLSLLGLVACGGGGGSGGGSNAMPAYTVTYNGNGHTSGSVPIDTANYAQGQIVLVFDNSGGLARAGCSFAGWNTQADGNGAGFIQGDSFAMGPANVTLYAKWAACVVEPTLVSIQDFVFTPTCATSGCHSGDAPAGGVNLEDGNSYANLVNVPANMGAGTLVVPGDPDNSVLINRLEQDPASALLMPQGGPALSQETINAIRGWISGL